MILSGLKHNTGADYDFIWLQLKMHVICSLILKLFVTFLLFTDKAFKVPAIITLCFIWDLYTILKFTNNLCLMQMCHTKLLWV